MVEALKKNHQFKNRRGPVVLVILDGVGIAAVPEGDGVSDAHTEYLDELQARWPTTKLKAHGTAVGLPSDEDMGNSEVGHNAIGCGRVYAQGAKRVNKAIEEGIIYQEETWRKLVDRVKERGGTLHFLGLLSDGNVHSNIEHLRAMIRQAKEEGVSRVRVHALLDGRDVGETSALEYVDPFEEFLAELSEDSFDARIASGGGRMQITMDRYHADWGMVERGWNTHVHGEGREFASAHEAIETLREETGAIDQDIPPFVIAENGEPVGRVQDGDSFILFNFRGDRALEITEAFEAGEEFNRFDRGRIPDVEYAGMMEYDGDLHVPKQYLVPPPSIQRTMGEYLAATGIKQYAISETQKFGHVTYFFNGNRSGMFNKELETYFEIPSDRVLFEHRPWMKAAQIADKVIEVIESGEFDFIRLNFPNGDMVGHTGIYEAVLCAMEAVDLSLGRIQKAVEKAGGVMVVSADHGNSDDMYARDKKGHIKIKKNGKPEAKTSHSLNPVPCTVFDPEGKGDYEPELREGLGISSLAATVIELLGFYPPEDYDPSVLELRKS
ncbi:MAG: 2,3-bisphosphoglycerate-independent phosphoglycerate mutase [Spirochaetaceae bacterium]